MAPSVLIFSKRVWDTLPPADQDIIRSAAKDRFRSCGGYGTSTK